MNTVFQPSFLLATRNRARLIEFGVFITSFFWIYYLSSILSPRLFGIGLDNFWFDADVPRYICQAVDRSANDHWRNKVHPLFSLMIYPIPHFLAMLGVEIIQAIRIQLSLVAAIGALFLFKTIRNIEISVFSSLLLIALGLSGATSLAWFTIPESYAYSFTAFSIVLFISTLSPQNPGIGVRWISAIAVAFSVTVTNLVVAGWAAMQSCGIRRAFVLSTIALVAVAGLAVVQRLLFPFSGIFFLPSSVQGEASFFVAISSERIRQVLALFFFGTLVFPDFQLVSMPNKDTFLTVQQAVWKGDSWLPTGAILLLSTFLFAGLLALFKALPTSTKKQGSNLWMPLAQLPVERLSAAVAGSVVFLVLLHLVYGTESFVYTGSFLPFLIIILGLGVKKLAGYSKALSAGLLFTLVAVNSAYGLSQWNLAVSEVRTQAASAPNDHAMARNICPFVKRQELF